MTNTKTHLLARRAIFAAVGALSAAPLLFAALTAHAQTKGASVSASPVVADNTPTTTLPVKAVTLFSSGVSYTLREGQVSGNATVPLTFRTVQINDLLKSMVLLDENGTVQPVVLQAKDPIGRTLAGFAVDVSNPPSRVDLLNQLRGAKVIVEAGGDVLPAGNGQSVQTPKRTLEGQIVGVEGSDGNGGGFSGTAVLSVLGEAGLQSVRLSEVKTVRLLDERLNTEFKNALSLLAAGSDDKRRTLVLHFDGNNTRRVRVGYVSEASLWKISYRLLLSGANETTSGATVPVNDANNASPYLQGWAMVENTSHEDWKNVRLSLVSGRPVSFIQDLYQPLYLPRPVVPPDVVASPYPQLAEGSIESKDDAPVQSANRATIGGGGGFGGAGFPKNAPASVAGALRSPALASPADSFADETLSGSASTMFRNSVVAQASGETAGELFRYNINAPVTLPRQQAALLPVIAQDVPADKVSVFNADLGSRFPLNAVRLKNNTKLHLKGGPVTIFDDGTYAGDARMEDVGPGDSRLLTYAVDLGIEAERQNAGATQTETTFSIRRGVLITARREKGETNYTLTNKTDKARTVLVEHPFNADYKLIAPAAFDERTKNLYRFAVPVAANQTAKLKVVVERPIFSSAELINYDVNTLAVFAQRKDISPKLRAALEEVVAKRRTISDLKSQAAQRDGEIASINTDQERIRKNMEALDKASALYKRYVAQLDGQETRLQTLRTESARLKNEAAAKERDLRAYLDGLDVAS